MLRWEDDHHQHQGEYPRWTVFCMGAVLGLLLGWIQHAVWVGRLMTGR